MCVFNNNIPDLNVLIFLKLHIFYSHNKNWLPIQFLIKIVNTYLDCNFYFVGHGCQHQDRGPQNNHWIINEEKIQSNNFRIKLN